MRHRSTTARLARGIRLDRRVVGRRRLRAVRRGRAWCRRRRLLRVETRRVGRYVKSARRSLLIEAAVHRLEPRRRSARRVVRGRRPLGLGTGRPHPGARMDSMSEATASISLRSASSASSAAASAARSRPRLSRAAEASSDDRIASDRVKPDDSSVWRARSVSSSSRTEIAFAMSLVSRNVIRFATSVRRLQAADGNPIHRLRRRGLGVAIPLRHSNRCSLGWGCRWRCRQQGAAPETVRSAGGRAPRVVAGRAAATTLFGRRTDLGARMVGCRSSSRTIDRLCRSRCDDCLLVPGSRTRACVAWPLGWTSSCRSRRFGSPAGSYAG